MDAHKNFNEYLEAKSNIVKYQTRDNVVFYLKGNKFSSAVARRGLGRKNGIGSVAKLFKKDELKIPGEHNFKNAIMASTVAKFMDCPDEIIRETVVNFSGLEHRLEFVKEIRLKDWKIGGLDFGVKSFNLKSSNHTIRFYNDSASTNPQTTIAAIKSFQEPSILIAGGYDKGLDYDPWGKIIRKTSVRLVILFGANKDKIKKSLKRFPIVIVNNLKLAVEAAISHSYCSCHRHSQIVLFSPGAASFDMFKDYADRGDKFKQLINNL